MAYTIELDVWFIPDYFTISTFLQMLFFTVLWLLGSLITLALLKKQYFNTNRATKFSIISSLGVLYLSILLARQMTLKRGFDVSLDQMKSAKITNDDEEKVNFYGKSKQGKMFNVKNVVHKKQVSVVNVRPEE